MPFLEYALLALLGSAGAAGPGEAPNGPSTRILTADTVSQPSGGTGFVGQKKPRYHEKVTKTGRRHRRHRRGHRPKLAADSGKKATNSKSSGLGTALCGPVKTKTNGSIG